MAPHLKTERHNLVIRNSTSKNVFVFSYKTQFATNEYKFITNEGVFAYHTCLHSQSLNSIYCIS